jgi:hypothetical protein
LKYEPKAAIDELTTLIKLFVPLKENALDEFPKRSDVKVAPFTVPLFPFPLSSFAFPLNGQ